MKFPSINFDIFKRSSSSPPSLSSALGRRRSSSSSRRRSKSAATPRRSHRHRTENSYRSASRSKFYPIEHFSTKHRTYPIHHQQQPQLQHQDSVWHLQSKPLTANDAQRLCYYTSNADVYEISNAKFYDYNANGIAIDHSVNDMNTIYQHNKECVGVPVSQSNSHFYVNLKTDQQQQLQQQQFIYKNNNINSNTNIVNAHQSTHLTPTMSSMNYNNSFGNSFNNVSSNKWPFSSDNNHFVNCVNSIGPLIQSTSIGKRIERHRRRKVCYCYCFVCME